MDEVIKISKEAEEGSLINAIDLENAV